MRKYVLKRILISIVILFFVSFIIYGLMRCLPTSYIERMAQQKAMAPGSKSYEEWLAQLEEMYHMNGGIISGFLRGWARCSLATSVTAGCTRCRCSRSLTTRCGCPSSWRYRLHSGGHHCHPPGRAGCHQAVQQDGLCHLCFCVGRYLPAYVFLCVPAEAGLFREAGLGSTCTVSSAVTTSSCLRPVSFGTRRIIWCCPS